jgi:hypothetical protein
VTGGQLSTSLTNLLILEDLSNLGLGRLSGGHEVTSALALFKDSPADPVAVLL